MWKLTWLEMEGRIGVVRVGVMRYEFGKDEVRCKFGSIEGCR